MGRDRYGNVALSRTSEISRYGTRQTVHKSRASGAGRPMTRGERAEPSHSGERQLKRGAYCRHRAMNTTVWLTSKASRPGCHTAPFGPPNGRIGDTISAAVLLDGLIGAHQPHSKTILIRSIESVRGLRLLRPFAAVRADLPGAAFARRQGARGPGRTQIHLDV